MYLLRRHPSGARRLLDDLASGAFVLAQLDERSLPWIAGFMERYRSLPAQFADAALVYLAEREGVDTVFTLDRRDFSVYRVGSGTPLRIVP